MSTGSFRSGARRTFCVRRIGTRGHRLPQIQFAAVVDLSPLIHHRCLCVRRKSSPLDGASDALVNSSPMELTIESLHSLGSCGSEVTPLASGPGQAGQLAHSAVAAVPTDNIRSRERRIIFMAAGLAKMNQNRSIFFSRV